MWKRIFAAVLAMALITAVTAGAEPIHSRPSSNKYMEAEMIRVVKSAVEDTNWLRVSSREEMEHLLANYYTGDLLQQLSDSGWRFVSRPNDWEYVVSAGRIDVEAISEHEGTAYAEILEKDEISGIVYSSSVRYFLIKNSDGWRIRAKTACLP